LLNCLVGGLLQEKGGAQGGEVGKGWFSKEERLGGWERGELLKGVVLILGGFFLFFLFSLCFALLLYAGSGC
jgi:protein HIRA/HIR1